MTGEKIGKESAEAFTKLDSVKQQAVIDKLTAETKTLEAKLAKQAAKENWSYQKFETERVAAKREAIKKVLKWAATLVIGGELFKHGMNFVP